jgi:5-methylcytosine-specific restriction endonuclease McrA
MRKLAKPSEHAEEVFLLCISRVQNSTLKTRLSNCKDLITEAAEEFDKKVTKGLLHTIHLESLVNGDLTAKELEDVYTLRMVGQGSPGRSLYDKLKLTPTYGICPLCSHRTVTTIDHYLPKAKYPRLSVVPVNLIPSCSDCNKLKLDAYPTCSEEESLHPYYDDLENEVWLKARVNQTTPPSIIFSVDPPSTWSKLLSDRAKFHFKILSLNSLYAAQAAVELTNINHRLNSIYKISGAKSVRQYLLENAESRLNANKNSWQTAMYTAIANDNWFCNGGFKL